MVGIEPTSMTALFCHNAADRSATSWHEALAPWEALEFVISDAAKGIASGLDRLARQRQGADDPTPLAQGLDLFHTAREAHTVLSRAWRRAEAAWAHAEARDILVAQAKRGGLDARGVAQTARAAWRQAVALLGCVERQESAWRRARAALDLFDAAGRLNTSQRARAEIAATLADLSGPAWKRVGNFLGDPRSTAFLDRMHEQLAKAEPRIDWREAMAWRWWCEQERPGAGGIESGQLVRRIGRSRQLEGAEAASFARVAAVLSRVVRASSAVECMNGVLRMQQCRHKRMTQPMLDLKRLYWNCRVLGAGKRRGACPYEHLGLILPTFDFWELLQTPPERLTQDLSGHKDAS